MPALDEVASARRPALHVVKLGSATLAHERVFAQLRDLRDRGARLLVVVGGAAGIAEHYRAVGREIRTLRLRGGNLARYCPPEEIPHLLAAYERVTLPLVEDQFGKVGLSAFVTLAHRGQLVGARAAGPVRVEEDGRSRVVRDHRAGTVSTVDGDRLASLLDAFDVVCLAPPVADVAGGTPLNVDADVLAAAVATALDADHLRLVTGTPGLLTDPDDPGSTLRHATAGDGQRYALGRMRQKVRAAELALAGTADVAITGPHTLSTRNATRFWRAPAPAADLDPLSRAVEVSSVSRDEREVAEFLADWCAEQGVPAEIDPAGNLVATRGHGSRRLLLLGHLDTVPHRWPVRWEGAELTGRGCVDAKASLVSYLGTLAELDLPPDVQVRVVGAVEEEITAAGAFFARDHYPADAVVVGEPSGAGALTIGYYGLVKVRLSVVEDTGHTAGRDARTAGDHLVAALHTARAAVADLDPEAMFAVLGVHAVNRGDVQAGEAVVDVRVPPALAVPTLLAVLGEVAAEPLRLEVLRATPGVATRRSSPLVRAFQHGFRAAGIHPRFVLKKGSSDMNSLATTWRDVPMVAYGPGDAALDHTPHERIHADEFRQAGAVLGEAVREWIRRSG